MSDFKTTEKDGVILDEYKGVYSLISTRQAANGNFYRQFATYQTGKDKHAEKDWPVKVTLGDAAGVINACLWMLQEVTGENYAPVVNGPHREQPVDSEDVPF